MSNQFDSRTVGVMSSEANSIAATDAPATVRSLIADLRQLGLADGDVVIVHTSLSALGWVAGGAQAVVEALLATVGSGTVVMPTQSGHLSHPAAWSKPPVPPQWVETLSEELPAYDPYLTPTRSMGQVVECFRHHPDAIRSPHPTVSFAAAGPHADNIVGAHPLSPGLGESSPLGRLYELDAKVLLLGVGHGNNTSLHLAEHRASWVGKSTYTEGSPVNVDGERRWVTYDDLDINEDDFPLLGDAFAATGAERSESVGAGDGRLLSQRAVVDFAVQWMNENRPASFETAAQTAD